MSKKTSTCPHVTTVGDNAWADVNRKKTTQDECDACDAHGPNLWLCLHSRCLFVGCGESASDHSSSHAEQQKHWLTLNMTTMRIWCYECETEVYRDNNEPALIMSDSYRTPGAYGPDRPMPLYNHPPTPPRAITPTMDDSESDDDEENEKPRGLTGLQNIGNTCYLNAAIQSLSNCPPLTRFFLDCSGYVRTDRKPLLCKSYMRLMSEMWHKKRPSYVVPSSVVHGIKIVHPMFRGYTQQDSQEFLRCFMDQIHEELKQPVIQSSLEKDEALQEEEVVVEEEEEEEDEDAEESHNTECDNLVSQVPLQVPEVTTPPSDTDYETCSSGQSSERSSVEHSLYSGDEGNEASGEPYGPHQQQQQQQQQHPEMEKSEPNNQAGDGDKVTPSDEKDDEENRDPSDSGIDSGSSTTLSSSDGSVASVRKSKVLKDTANLASQHHRIASAGTLEQIIPGAEEQITKAPDNDTTEFIDAVSEMDPLQKAGGVKKSRTQQAASDRVARTKTTSERPLSGRSPRVTVHSGKKKKMTRYRSVISDIFDGRLLSSVQCLTCERISSTKETFQDLSLPIPTKDHLHMIHASKGAVAVGSAAGGTHKGTCGEVSLNQGWLTWMLTWMKGWFWGPTINLQDCLAAFFSADELKGDNMYSCEKCKKLRNGMKYSKVLDLPEILCVHLKRFRHEFMFSSKISTYVSFPMEGLDMGPYLHKDHKDQMTLYDLVAVICHHGTAGGGHYTSYSLNYTNEQWYEFDDQYVTEVDMQQVENCEAYVLFYRKRSEQMIPIRQQGQLILDSPEIDSFMKFYVSKQWINKFNTFSSPGPIKNHDFLCKHGGVHPHKWNYIGELVEEVPQKLWEFFHERFGGGPAVNHLYVCTTCQLEMERLKKRQRYEMDTFLQLHKDFQNDDYPGQIFAISMVWFKDWENFVRGRTDDPPGPVENQKIAVLKSGQPTIRTNSDHGQLSEEMWQFLAGIYGGGPELILKTNRPSSPAAAAAPAPVSHEAGDVRSATENVKA